MWHLSVQKKSEGSVTFVLEMVEEGWGGGNENHIQWLLTLTSIFVLPFSGVNWRFPGHVIFTEGCDNERKDRVSTMWQMHLPSPGQSTVSQGSLLDSILSKGREEKYKCKYKGL